jgi:hypothetical protein
MLVYKSQRGIVETPKSKAQQDVEMLFFLFLLAFFFFFLVVKKKKKECRKKRKSISAFCFFGGERTN